MSYVCPMCQNHNKHNLCSPIFCDCKHPQVRKDPKPKKGTSVKTVSGGLPTLGKGHK